MRYEFVLRAISKELDRAEAKFSPMRTLFDGYGTLEEEVHELRDSIRQANKTVPPTHLDHVTKEAIHVAAIAVRFLVDVCPDYLTDETEVQ